MAYDVICIVSSDSLVSLLQIRIAPKVIQDEKDDNINNEIEEPEKEATDLKPYATLNDLARGKLPPEEILSLPMFKVLYHVYFNV